MDDVLYGLATSYERTKPKSPGFTTRLMRAHYGQEGVNVYSYTRSRHHRISLPSQEVPDHYVQIHKKQIVHEEQINPARR
jgi:hypothetical protein